MRLRGYDEETEEYSDDVAILTGKIADLTKTAKTPGGISLFTDETRQTYKSTYEILVEIADIWDELTDTQHASLVEAIGGKKGGQIAASIISNIKSATDSIEVMNASAGKSALPEYTVMCIKYIFNCREYLKTYTTILEKS